jgi:hypothetical protein
MSIRNVKHLSRQMEEGNGKKRQKVSSEEKKEHSCAALPVE